MPPSTRHSLYPPTDPFMGDIWIHAYTYSVYIWNGSQWVDFTGNVQNLTPDDLEDTIDQNDEAYKRAMKVI